MKGDPRESYENESLEESKLDLWYGNPNEISSFGISTLVAVLLIVGMFILYYIIKKETAYQYCYWCRQ